MSEDQNALVNGNICPECGSKLVRQEKCKKCPQCGWGACDD